MRKLNLNPKKGAFEKPKKSNPENIKKTKPFLKKEFSGKKETIDMAKPKSQIKKKLTPVQIKKIKEGMKSVAPTYAIEVQPFKSKK
jgi:hypothetical protein